LNHIFDRSDFANNFRTARGSFVDSNPPQRHGFAETNLGSRDFSLIMKITQKKTMFINFFIT
jgi:hypothetical protein